MEEIKQILLELSREVKEMRNDISQNNKEMKSLREDVRTMQVNWEKEKLDLEEKITKTEEKIEKLEKDKIRNNLIVTGMRMETEDEELLRNTMEKKINKELSLNVKKKIRDFAKKERINGATVRVKYQGVEIDGRSWKWNKKEQKLMKVGEIKAPKN
ncbi:ribonuclease Y-like [Tenebrio molitor]|uniref:ribonuclease Y-like n=1 Tax=Tenebrio molitor TaxID=7067 RepID=UPI003624A3E5